MPRSYSKQELIELAQKNDFHHFMRGLMDVDQESLREHMHTGFDSEKNQKLADKFYFEANAKPKFEKLTVQYRLSISDSKKMAYNEKLQVKLHNFIAENLRNGTLDSPDDSVSIFDYAIHVYATFEYTSDATKRKNKALLKAEIEKILAFYMTEQLDTDLAEIEAEKKEKPSFLKKIGQSIVHAFDSPKKTEQMKQPAVNAKPETTDEKNLEAMNAHLAQPTATNNATPMDLTYIPSSDACPSLDTTAPESLRYEMMKAVQKIDKDVNDVDDYVSRKLGYAPAKCSKEEREHGVKCLCDSFGAEQIDAVAVCIYNIENRHESTIIGDMTGIGKGRVAAGVLEYARQVGLIPIFFTEKSNLFSDIMRDLIAIGSDDGIPKEFLLEAKKFKKTTVTKAAIKEAREAAIEDGEDPNEAEEQLWIDAEDGGSWVSEYQKNTEYNKQIIGRKRFVPFIVNDPDAKTAIKDGEGNILYQSVKGAAKAAKHGELPEGFDGIFLTYSQIAGTRANAKRDFIKSLAGRAVIVLDESHNASGQSNTKKFLQEILLESKGAVFLSATFAKRPDNMPIYAAKTVIREAGLDDAQLEAAIKRGGVALQEIISAQLTREGEHLRRERTYEGIEVNYMNLDESQLTGEHPHPEYNLKAVHTALADRTTQMLRDIMDFQRDEVKPVIEELNKDYKSKLTKGTEEGGIRNPPIFNGVFQLISQMLFSIKAEVVAKHAIERMKEGKKPIIAFSNTMESFLNTLTNESGGYLSDGETIVDDFSYVFRKRLKNCMKYTITTPEGDSFHRNLLDNIDALPPTFMPAYRRLLKSIEETKLGLSLSPIDTIYYHIQNAGFTVNEVTGRNKRLKINGDGTAIYTNREKLNATDTFRMYNDNELDCLLINRAGATGVSAHALPTKKVPEDKVKQRVMIILQAELDVNQEVQKRGRINRTGQKKKPIYDYMICSVPAEQRYMMMLQKKLKSLDANTSAKQDQSSALLSVDDFLNKYGDKYVTEWLCNHISFHNEIGAPLGDLAEQVRKYGSESNVPVQENAAYKVAGKVAILPCAKQAMFYDEILNIYNGKIEELVQSGDYDLEVQYLKLEAETESKSVVAVGNDKGSVFSRHSILEKCTVNNLSKPYTEYEVRAMVDQTLSDENGNRITAQQYADNLKEDIDANSKMLIERYETEIRNEMKQKLEIYKTSPSLISAKAGKKKKAPAIKAIEGEPNTFEMQIDTVVEEEPTLTPEEINKIISDKEKELTEKMEERIAEMIDVEKKEAAVKKGAVDFFRVGRVIRYPQFESVSVNDMANPESVSAVKGIFLGFTINKNQKNPYIKSNIKLRFALASTMRYRSISLTNGATIMACRDLSRMVPSVESYEYVLNKWNAEVKLASDDRVTRYIVTGNVLRVMAEESFESGKLISYTTIRGGIKKGLMLPAGFDPRGKKKIHGEDEKAIRVTVPLLAVLPMLEQSDADQNPLQTSLGITITKKNAPKLSWASRQPEGYEYEVVMSSHGDNKKYYSEDRVLVDLMRNGFNSIKPNMVGKMNESDITKLITHLANEYHATASLSQAQFDTYILPTLTLSEYDDEEVLAPAEKTADEIAALDTTAQHMADEKAKQEAIEAVDLDKEQGDKDALLLMQKQAELTAVRNLISKQFVKLNAVLEAELGI